MGIHDTAIIDKDVLIAEDVKVGPFCVIGKGVKIEERTEIAAHVHIERNTHIGKGCKISSGAVLGGDPQILDWQGANSFVKIGNNTTIREFVTIHRSSKEGESTIIGDDCFLMAYTHIAHDCCLENGVVIVNYTGLTGHVSIGEKAVISGYVGMHQFIRIGKLSMVSGLSRLPKDILPYSIVEGNPVRVVGINSVGLRRADIPSQARNDLKKAFMALCHSNLNTAQALSKIKEEIDSGNEIQHLIEFIETSRRGVCK